jgi:Mn2+/Fe2+ NRAMP family transporter
VKAGFFDSLFGMCVLAGVTSVIMITSAATFHGKVTPEELSDAGKMSSQLRSSFGAASSWIFCFGFLSGAFSSFLVNAMIGGHIFSDGIGLGSSLQSKGARHLTSLALLVGMVIGIASLVGGFDRTTTIVIAQASTVIGGPAVVAGLLFLGWRHFLKEPAKPPLWALIITSAAMFLTLAVATTTGKKVVGKIQQIAEKGNG